MEFVKHAAMEKEKPKRCPIRYIAITLFIATYATIANAQNAEQLFTQSSHLFKAKKYAEAITLLHDNEAVFETENKLSSLYGELSWYYLFTKDFNLSEQAAHRALEIDSTQIWVKTNLAHAFFFQGRFPEAEKIYYELANIIYEDESYASTLLDDFEQLENAGIIPNNYKIDFEIIKDFIIKINEVIKIVKQFVDLFLDDCYEEISSLLESSIVTLSAQSTQLAADVLENIGIDYYNFCNYTEAEKYFLVTKTIRERVLGNDHPDYASSLNNLGILYSDLGNYAEAKEYYMEAKTIRERVLGNDHPDYASSLYNLGILYSDMGNYAEAEEYHMEAKTIRERVLGNDHPDYASSLNNLGILYSDMGNYTEAEEYYMEAKTIRERVLGNDHPDYASSLNNLGTLYSHMGNYAEAEAYHLEAKTIRERVLGKDHPDYASSLYNLGILYRLMGNYAEAEEYQLEAKTIRERVLGNDHPDYASSLYNLGNLYSDLGNYAEAEEYYMAAKTILERVLGKDHPDYASSLNNLGILYHKMGSYFEAEKYHLEAKTIRERVFGKYHLSYAISLNNLGNLYSDMGNYTEAEEYYMAAKTILERVLGKDHPDYAVSLNNLGILYSDMGNYAEAEKYCMAAKTIRERVLGNDHPDYASSLNNLGTLYSHMGNYAEAEEYYMEAKTIRERVLGNDHPDYASSLNNLGILYSNMGNYAEAEENFMEAKTIRERVLGNYHLDYASSLNNLGVLYRLMGNYTEAEEYYLEAKTIRERVLGKDHPNNETILNNLSVLYLAMKNFGYAQVTKIEADQLQIAHIETNFAFLSEQQRTLFWDAKKVSFEASYSFVSAFPVHSITTHVYNNTLFTKGLLLRTTNGIREAIYASNNNELISQFEQLGNLRKQIINLQQKEAYNKEFVQTLQEQADKLDKEVTKASQDYRELKADISKTWQDVQRELKPTEAAIEFVHFQLFDKQWTDSTMYAALIVRPEIEAPIWIPLFEQEKLETLLQSEYKNTKLQIENLYSQKGDQLYQLIWQSLEKELQDVKTVYYSPSGLLHKISFNSIPTDQKDILLSDKYNLHLLSSSREIALLKNETSVSPIQDTTVVYGGLTYDEEQLKKLVAVQPSPKKDTLSKAESDAIRRRRRSLELPDAELRSGFSAWNYLGGTKVELDQIVSVLEKKHIPYQHFKEEKGTEETFKHLSGTNTEVIHLATHGFFLPDVETKNEKELIQRIGGNRERPFENPLLRSGLILSSANRQWIAKENIMEEGVEDGILTANEIAQLNLTHTKLVVLSACETGLGDVKNSEGVFGLQRAFKLAGVESLIMSLWKVPDAATAELMTLFYEQWLSGQTKQDAFKAAQQIVREKYKSPYYWAAFVLMD